MKKFLIAIFGIFFSILAVSASEVKFIQIDGVRYNPDDETSVKRFEKIREDINHQKNIDFVIFSGDNIAKSNPVYLKKFLKASKKINAPVYLALGNKDVNKKKGVGKADYIKVFNKNLHLKKKIKTTDYEFVKNNIVFIVPDGSKEFLATPNGYYRDKTLNWLNEKLNRYENKNVVIIQHFPIIPMENKELYITYKYDDYLKILNGKTNVKAVFSGLYDINSEQNIDGVLYVTTERAPKYRVVEIVDCETDNPVIWSSVAGE